jgi:hypothetical protein
MALRDGFHSINSPDLAQVVGDNFMWISDFGTTVKNLRLKQLDYVRVIVGFKK